MAQQISDQDLKNKIAAYGLAKEGTHTALEVRQSVTADDITKTWAIEDPEEQRAAEKRLTEGSGKLRPVLVWADKDSGAKIIAEPQSDGTYIITHDQRGSASGGKAETISAPANQPYIGFADANAPGGIRWERNQNFPTKSGETYEKPVYDDAGKKWVQPVTDAASGKLLRSDPIPNGMLPAKAKEDAKPPTERVDPENPGKRQRWNPSLKAGEGDWEEAGGVYQKPEPVKDEETYTDPVTKELFAVERNPDRTIKGLRKVDKPETKSAGMPKIPNDVIIGGHAKVLADVANGLMEEYKAGRRTAQDVNDTIERVRGIMATMVQDQIAATNAQQNLLTSDVTQRGQTINDQISRRSAATSAFKDSLDYVQKTAPYMPASERGQGGPSPFLAIMKLNQMFQESMGAMQPIAEATKAAGLQAIMSQRMGEQAKQPGPSQSSAASSQQPGGVNINIGVPPAPSGFMAPAVGDFAPPPGLTNNDGFVRAPGYVAPDPPEDDPVAAAVQRAFGGQLA